MKIAQKAVYQKDNWWKWAVWIEASEQKLKQIEYVEYILHSSFAEPVRRITNRTSKFRLSSFGWGEFTIRAVVVTKNGEKTNLRHRLELSYPSKQVTETKDKATSPGTIEPPVLFLSCNISDSLFAHALKKALIEKGAQAYMVADESSGLPWEASINQLLTKTDYALFIISETLSIWMTRELEATIELKIPIIPVLIVSNKLDFSQLPPSLKKPIQIKAVPVERFGEEAKLVAEGIYVRIAEIGKHTPLKRLGKAV
jgi:hypothetical protein